MKYRQPTSPAAMPQAVPRRLSIWERISQWLDTPPELPKVVYKHPLMNLAAVQAARRRSSVPTSDDLFLATSADAQVTSALLAMGIEPDDLTAEVMAAARDYPHKIEMSIVLVEHLKKDRPDFSVEFCVFLVALRPGSALANVVFKKIGLTPRQVRWRFVHPDAAIDFVPIAGADDKPAELVMFNDELTHQEQVRSILESVVGMTPEDAHAAMMAVHKQGSAKVAEGTYGSLVEVLTRMVEAAEGFGAPLRMDVQIS